MIKFLNDVNPRLSECANPASDRAARVLVAARSPPVPA